MTDLSLTIRAEIADDALAIERLHERTFGPGRYAKTAYRVVRDAAIPQKDNYRAEHQFTAGWIALRFLNDPATALAHFAKVAQGHSNPIALARAGYWQGRAAEALGRRDEARAHYEAGARYSTAYYGQLARARLGHKDIVVRPPPEPPSDRRDPPPPVPVDSGPSWPSSDSSSRSKASSSKAA